MKNISFSSLIKILSIAGLLIFSSCSTSKNITKTTAAASDSYSWLKLDTVKAGKFDNGRMWTFEYPPLDYFKQTYNFTPTQDWLDHVRMSALRFANYCSASFVSGDGLIMTNDHCARESVVQVSKEGEDLFKNGFYADSLGAERPVPGLYVDQLVLIKDVTKEIQSRVDSVKSDYDKLFKEDQVINELEKKESDSTGLKVSVVPLYDGAKYSLYGYKRYTDVRLVFAPESQMGYFGGDPDNFTYPRYDLDCSFFRVYDDSGKPLKTKNYFKWSPNGANPGEPIFVVGNPGSTKRLSTVSQLEYMRDISYPRTLDYYNGMVNVYTKLINDQPEKKDEYIVQQLRYLNSQKAFKGMLAGLRDPVLMQRKKDFEETFKTAVQSDKKLDKKYGNLWNEIDSIQVQKREVTNKLYILTMNSRRTSEYFFIASDVIYLARELKKPEDKRDEEYIGGKLDSTIQNLFPADIDKNYEMTLLQNQVDLMIKYLGKDNKVVKKITGGKTPKQAAEYMVQNSYMSSEDKIKELVNKGADAILKSDDPFIYFIVNTEIEQGDLQQEANQLAIKEFECNSELGKALFAVYGISIPPDATFTLRISDGVIKGFPYNGTIAPPFTTFYGMYDRYYSFGKKDPFELPKKWQNPPADFDLEVPFNFVSTNDIIGGNSGSPVINEKAQIVGLAFDGNIQSLPGDFIFTEDENRCVAVHSAGLVEALKKIYKADRLTDELKNGKIEKEVNTVEK